MTPNYYLGSLSQKLTPLRPLADVVLQLVLLFVVLAVLRAPVSLNQNLPFRIAHAARGYIFQSNMAEVGPDSESFEGRTFGLIGDYGVYLANIALTGLILVLACFDLELIARQVYGVVFISVDIASYACCVCTMFSVASFVMCLLSFESCVHWWNEPLSVYHSRMGRRMIRSLPIHCTENILIVPM